jgi:streptogramin lyase
VPTDTLSAAASIARAPWHQPEKIFALLERFYPVPASLPKLRPTPFIPYLGFAPSAWTLPLKFSGGGLAGGGKLMFDAEGNAWVVDNFMVGAQNQDAFWGGALSKFAPNGRPLSPAVTGFTGGGIRGPGFGLTLDPAGRIWTTSFAGTRTISTFDSNGKPLSPPEGYPFGGRIGQLQGIIATPNGDIWAADLTSSQLIHLPKGDAAKGEVLCHNPGSDPFANPCKLFFPFALALDQHDNIWVTNALGDNVTRFPASDPTKAQTFKAGYSGSGLAIDSLGNVWITNKLGNSERGHLKMLEMIAAGKINYDGDPDATSRLSQVLVDAMVVQTPGWEGGSLTVLRPDGSEAAFSPVYGRGITGPWAVSVDGNDHIWVSNFTTQDAGIVELCGFRTETCPPGMKTGDAISPPGGYVGGGLQLQVDVGIGPAGDVWATNNWQDHTLCYGRPSEAVSTRCGGEGVVVFYGMAKPVLTPLIGPPRASQ